MANPEHYICSELVVGQSYEVAAICLHGENRVPAFKLKDKEDIGWITERFFKRHIIVQPFAKANEVKANEVI
jgi:hypothetical protein